MAMLTFSMKISADEDRFLYPIPNINHSFASAVAPIFSPLHQMLPFHFLFLQSVKKPITFSSIKRTKRRQSRLKWEKKEGGRLTKLLPLDYCGCQGRTQKQKVARGK
jgi:hypothetical protein